MPFSYQS